MLLKVITIIVIICQVEADNSHCNHLLRQLGNKQQDYIYCVTTNSAPVTMCTACEGHYEDLRIAFDKIATDSNCTAMYFDKDRINMVASTNAVLEGLWSKAYCDDCYHNNNSIVFDEKNKNFTDCITQYPKEACEACKAQYMDLNNFYINLDQHNNGEVCYDLQDSMNRTRNYWSKELKCCRREYNMTFFTIALCIISSLPFIFYGSTYLLTKRQERNHGILSDEDPLLNASAPSSAASILNSNNPSSSRNNIAPATENVTVATSNSADSQVLNKEQNQNDFSIASNKMNANKKLFNLVDSDDESSDEENLAKLNTARTKIL